MEIGQATMVRLEFCFQKKASKRSNKKKASLCVEPIKNIMAARQNRICICPQKITVIQIHIVQSFIFLSFKQMRGQRDGNVFSTIPYNGFFPFISRAPELEYLCTHKNVP
jgi:hypothetical protein